MKIRERLFRVWKWYSTLNYLYCPACNSDAPKLYDCWCCRWYRGGFPPPKETRQLWKQKYWALYNFEKDEHHCDKCMWVGKWIDLRIYYDIEQFHPLNKGKSKHDPHLHKTEFRQCPQCGRNLFADGKPLSRLTGGQR